MPKYVYQDLKTGEHYEFEQGFHDEAYTHHPETGAPIKRLIFAPAVVFKGSGWYAKDSKKSSTGPSKPSEATESNSGGETPSENKTAQNKAPESKPASSE